MRLLVRALIVLSLSSLLLATQARGQCPPLPTLSAEVTAPDPAGIFTAYLTHTNATPQLTRLSLLPVSRPVR